MIRRLKIGFVVFLFLYSYAFSYSERLEDLFLKGCKYFYDGHYAEALRIFKKTVNVDPNFAEGYCGIGVTLYKMGKLRESLVYFAKSIKCNSKYACPYWGMGLVYSHLNNSSKAINMFKKAALTSAYDNDTTSEGSMAYIHGRRYMVVGSYQEVTPILMKYIRLHPKDAVALYTLGVAYTDVRFPEPKRLQKGISFLEKAVQLNPNLAEAHLYLYLNYMYLCDCCNDESQKAIYKQKAFKEYKKAKELNPELGNDSI